MFKKKKTSMPFQIGTPERKILVSLSYYVLLVIFSLTSFTFAARNVGAFGTQLISYFSCETNGHNPEMPCDRDLFRQFSEPGLATVASALLALFPILNLVYALNIEELKEKWWRCRGKKPARTSTFTNSERLTTTSERVATISERFTTKSSSTAL